MFVLIVEIGVYARWNDNIKHTIFYCNLKHFKSKKLIVTIFLYFVFRC